jgi:signal transduction histidine kinase
VLLGGVRDDDLRSLLLSVRGQIARAERVSYNTKLFDDLANERSITILPERMTAELLIRRLREAVSDTESVFQDYGITFRLHEGTFRHQLIELVADRELLIQALLNILENAGKYSYVNTPVIVTCGFTKSKRFFIAVQNTGIPIRPEETTRVLERGWQSEAALASSGAGSGIGLWIADNIMKAHGGEVVVVPTRRDYVTEIRLVFPSAAARTRP